MRRNLIAIAVLVGAVVSPGQPAAGVTLTIEQPADGACVPERPNVTGAVSDAKAKVWVVVHPLEVATYWVQPRLTVRSGGRWKTRIHIGRPGRVDVGKEFEMMAVVNPRSGLSNGQQLGDWPEAEAVSNVVEVTRCPG